MFYLCRGTRFDIAHAVSEVAKFMGNPAPEHWDAVLRIYAYLARTKDVALVMRSNGMQCELYEKFLEQPVLATLTGPAVLTPAGATPVGLSGLVGP